MLSDAPSGCRLAEPGTQKIRSFRQFVVVSPVNTTDDGRPALRDFQQKVFSSGVFHYQLA